MTQLMLDKHTLNLLERLVIATEEINETLKGVNDILDNIDSRTDDILDAIQYSHTTIENMEEILENSESI